MLCRSWFHLRVVLYVVCIVALLTACTASNGQDLPIDYKVQLTEKLTSFVSGSEPVRLDRNRTIVSLKQSNFPKWLLDLYSKELDARNPEAVYDIAKIDGLWSEDFATRLVDIFGRVRSLEVRNTVIDAITKRRGFIPGERTAMTSLLRANGELDIGKAKPDRKFIELLGRMGDASAISYLVPFLSNNSGVDSGIGLSQPLPRLPPKLRISDCAHDAILSCAGGSLEARVAVAYEELGFSNQFDPRRIFLSPPGEELGAVQEDDDELVTRSGAEDDRRLYREVQAIRDKLNRDLTKQLTDLRFISP